MGYFPTQLAWSSDLSRQPYVIKITIFIVSIETVMGMSHFYILDYLRWNQRLYRAFITDEVFITPVSGLQKTS